MAINIIPPRVAIVDPNTGLMTREFYLFLQNLFQIPDNGDTDVESAALAPFGSADVALSAFSSIENEAGLAPTAVPVFQIVDDVLPSIGSLPDQLAALGVQINGIEQRPLP